MTPKDSFFNPQCSSLPTHCATPHFIRDIICLLFIVNPRGKKLPFILGEVKGGTNFLCLSFPKCKKGDACMVVPQIIWNVLCFYFIQIREKQRSVSEHFLGGAGAAAATPQEPQRVHLQTHLRRQKEIRTRAPLALKTKTNEATYFAHSQFWAQQ